MIVRAIATDELAKTMAFVIQLEIAIASLHRAYDLTDKSDERNLLESVLDDLALAARQVRGELGL